MTESTKEGKTTVVIPLGKERGKGRNFKNQEVLRPRGREENAQQGKTEKGVEKVTIKVDGQKKGGGESALNQRKGEL